MGTGKSAAGREIARRLGRRFVDLDEQIEEQAGRTIAAIFAEEGEARFRELERAACEELRRPQGIVAAVGGGAVVDPANREAFEAGGTAVCLHASAAAILERVGAGTERPMLGDADPRGREARVAALMAERDAAYRALPHHLDTTGLAVADVAEQVMAIAAGLPAGTHLLPVRTGSTGADASYPVLVGSGLLEETGRQAAARGVSGRCAVVTNPDVGALYASRLAAALGAAGLEPVCYELPEGEAHKRLQTVATLYDRFAGAGLARDEAIFALGGGVIGDMAGFAAATWLRGVPFVQVPTTLLAMVDASIGGKVAVDLPQGKNLVGAFKQPELVLADVGTLRSLPPAEYRAGLAEVIKAAIIGDPALFDRLERGETGPSPALVAAAARVKIDLVERDPFERGDRAWLNLGHTFGHALEQVSGFQLRHGDAVAIGTVAAAEMGVLLGLCSREDAGRIRSAIRALGLPTGYAFDEQAARAAMAGDKKRAGRKLRFVVPLRIGQVTVVEAPPEAVIGASLRSVQTPG